MPRLQFTQDARLDVANIASYIALQSGNRKLARTFVARLRAKCVRLASLTGAMGRSRSELGRDLRSTAYGNYVIFYRYVGDVIEIVNVL